ncbi:hypothetical protein [Streptomyces echinatus]|uniref:Methyltransferase n=1 Tax=Streptomyces echinatus TaxID=67293 RepID=A0A7W9UVK2_9ACTN|nr:hypothetical protein [Streptomyces echinatus]MBB5932880.1 hypothetical protein [Streptomyces echinatus]
MSYASYRLPAHQLAELLNQAGFTITAQLVQEPDEKRNWKFASFLAHKPTTEEPA